ALVVGEQHGDVLAGGGGGGGHAVDAEGGDGFGGRGVAVAGGVGDDLGTGGQGGGGHGVHIADDHVRSVAGLGGGGGWAVDADEQRAVFADVGGQHRQVLLVVVAADDDEHVPVGEVGAHFGHDEFGREQIGVLADVFDRVVDEVHEHGVHARLGRVHVLSDRL